MRWNQKKEIEDEIKQECDLVYLYENTEFDEEIEKKEAYINDDDEFP